MTAMIARIAAFTVVVLACGSAWSADLTLPEHPVGVLPPTPGSSETLVVSWGGVGPWQRSDPRDIEREIIEFREFFNDEVVRAVIRRAALRMADISLDKAKKAMAEIETAWRSQELNTDMVGVQTTTTTVKALTDVPEWMRGLPPEMRMVSVLVFYDDRDLNQRQWVMDTARGFTDNHLVTVIAAGWKSRESLRQFMLANPGLPISAFGDQLAKDYGVTHLPAVIDFPDDDHVRYQVGYGRPAVVRQLLQNDQKPAPAGR